MKYKITVVIEGDEKDYLEMKNAIESGEFQRDAKKDGGTKTIKATIEKLTP